MDEVRRDVMRMIKAGGTIFFTKDGENVREMSEKADVIETIEKISERTLTKNVKDNLMRMLTIAVGFKVSTQIVGAPIFLQPRFLVVATKAYLGVQTYGFVESTHNNILGSGDPSTKYTRYICKAMSPNFYEDEASGDSLKLHVSIYETSEKTTQNQMYTELRSSK